jgi:serine/threonine protein kinase
MRPELDDTLAAGAAVVDLSSTATAPRTANDAAHGLVAGQQLGHFRIERPLGAGGMGEVYLATDLALDRPVAIKVLPSGVARDPGRRDRLIREARAQARITHPNVGHIYFIGEEAGRLYFAMEYVAGDTVAARLAKGPLAVDDALAIIRSAALGLREAQRNGITHRDIKPSNLMIDGHGMVKVLDFGLAASAPGQGGTAGPDPGDAPNGSDALGTAPVAQTSLGGTPLYMAPEQARGEPVDFQSDIYALGATLFHLVSGHPPFEADSLDALLSKHASAERPTLPRRSGQPRTAIAAIDALCSRMMAPARADRFASYDELIRTLELASGEHVRPAGFWVRAMAASADLLLSSLAILVVVALLALVTKRSIHDEGVVVFAMYAAASIALIARNGRTFGQSLFELEVVDTATGARPTLGRTAVRVVLPIAIPALGTVLSLALGLFDYRLVGWLRGVLLAALFLPPVALLWASLRRHDKQAIWDRVSRTMVRYRTRRTTPI